MPEFDATVEYRPTPPLPSEFYRVGSDGSVWGCQKPGAGAAGAGRWARRKGVPIGKGYRGVRLGVKGVHKTHYIHRLVLEAFVGECPKGMECRHLNGNKADNRLDNLAWGTREENVADKFRHGTQHTGSRVYRAKLTEGVIPTIRERLARGDRIVDIARDYGVTDSAIDGVKRRLTWKHVPAGAVLSGTGPKPVVS
jgi:hypothetical protein